MPLRAGQCMPSCRAGARRPWWPGRFADRRPVAECGFELQPNAEAHLRPRLRLASLYSSELLAETVRIADLCNFSLDELRYEAEFPVNDLPGGRATSQIDTGLLMRNLVLRNQVVLGSVKMMGT